VRRFLHSSVFASTFTRYESAYESNALVVKHQLTFALLDVSMMLIINSALRRPVALPW